MRRNIIIMQMCTPKIDARIASLKFDNFSDSNEALTQIHARNWNFLLNGSHSLVMFHYLTDISLHTTSNSWRHYLHCSLHRRSCSPCGTQESYPKLSSFESPHRQIGSGNRSRSPIAHRNATVSKQLPLRLPLDDNRNYFLASGHNFISILTCFALLLIALLFHIQRAAKQLEPFNFAEHYRIISF